LLFGPGGLFSDDAGEAEAEAAVLAAAAGATRPPRPPSAQQQQQQQPRRGSGEIVVLDDEDEEEDEPGSPAAGSPGRALHQGSEHGHLVLGPRSRAGSGPRPPTPAALAAAEAG
ncbi:hypothetical protein EG865_15580, partial [Enterococcus faecalis]